MSMGVAAYYSRVRRPMAVPGGQHCLLPMAMLGFPYGYPIRRERSRGTLRSAAQAGANAEAFDCGRGDYAARTERPHCPRTARTARLDAAAAEVTRRALAFPWSISFNRRDGSRGPGEVKACVIDSNIAAKWVLPPAGEAFVDHALRLLDRHGKGDLQFVVPDLFWAETGNILWKAVRYGRCSKASAENS